MTKKIKPLPDNMVDLANKLLARPIKPPPPQPTENIAIEVVSYDGNASAYYAIDSDKKSLQIKVPGMDDEQLAITAAEALCRRDGLTGCLTGAKVEGCKWVFILEPVYG